MTHEEIEIEAERLCARSYELLQKVKANGIPWLLEELGDLDFEVDSNTKRIPIMANDYALLYAIAKKVFSPEWEWIIHSKAMGQPLEIAVMRYGG